MKNILFTLVIILCSYLTKAQVGINTTSPKASLDIEASNNALPSYDDGILIPRIDEFSTTTPSSDQDGMLVFATGNGTPSKGFYYWDVNAVTWVPLNKTRHYIGELYGGGIVYYVYDDGHHGLIASLDDLDGGTGVQWYNGSYTTTGATDYYNGASNTTIIVSSQGLGTYAAKLCDDYVNDGYTDWYLPSTIEFRQMDTAILTINNILENDGNSTTNSINPKYELPAFGRYWSSTEVGSSMAFVYNFTFGATDGGGKSDIYKVRAIRAF